MSESFNVGNSRSFRRCVDVAGRRYGVLLLEMVEIVVSNLERRHMDWFAIRRSASNEIYLVDSVSTTSHSMDRLAFLSR